MTYNQETNKIQMLMEKLEEAIPTQHDEEIMALEKKYLNNIELSRDSYKRLFTEGLELIRREKFPRSLMSEILDEYTSRLEALPNFDLRSESISEQDEDVKEKFKELILFGTQAVLINDNARLLSKLHETNSSYMELLSVVTHEFKNILTSLHGYNGILKRKHQDEQNEGFSEIVEAIGRLIKKMFNMVDSLLKMSLSEKNVLHPERKLIDFSSDVLQPVENELLPLLQRKNMQLRKKIQSENLMLMADEELLQTVMRNLLDNAIKYGYKKTPLDLSVSSDKKNLYIELKNEGPGIPKEIEKHIFEKFVRSKVGNIRGGTGLGLYNIKNIIESHGGFIRAESSDNRYVVFKFGIPQRLN